MSDPGILFPNPATESAKSTRLRTLFIGPYGLRAGWGALLFILFWAAIFAGCSYGAYFLFNFHRPHHMTEMTPRLAFGGESLQIIAALGATWAMSRIEHRRFAAYGFSGSRFFSLFARGLAIGFCGLSLLILILSAAGVWHYDGVHMHGGTAWSYGVIWAILFVLVGVAEEATLRGYLLFTLARGITIWPAAILLSLLFGALHLGNGGENAFGIVTVVAAGLMLSFVVWRTGSLALAFGIHAAWDWAQSYFYGTADSGLHMQGHLLSSHSSGKVLLSGGADGPEGSILAIPVMLLIMLAVHFTAGQRRPLSADR